MKLLVWIVFWLSLLGFTLSAMLRARSVQELLLSLWVSATDRAERSSMASAPELACRMIMSIYAGRTSVSILKVLSIVVVASLLNLAQLAQLATFPRIAATAQPVPDPLTLFFNPAIIQLVVISQVIYEFVPAYIIVFMLRRRFNPSMKRVITTVVLANLAGVITIGALVFSTTLLIRIWMNAPSYVNGVGMAPLIPTFIALKSLLGFGTHTLQDFSQFVFGLLALAIWWIALGSIVVASLCLTSRAFLRILALLAERLGTNGATQLHNISLLGFTLATGVMQAYGFS